MKSASECNDRQNGRKLLNGINATKLELSLGRASNSPCLCHIYHGRRPGCGIFGAYKEWLTEMKSPIAGARAGNYSSDTPPVTLFVRIFDRIRHKIILSLFDISSDLQGKIFRK